MGGSEEDFRRSVPQGDHFTGKGMRRDGLGAGETEIGEFEFANFADEQILWLQITVEDLALVHVAKTAQQLEEKEAHVGRMKTAWMPFQILSQIRMLPAHELKSLKIRTLTKVEMKLKTYDVFKDECE